MGLGQVLRSSRRDEPTKLSETTQISPRTPVTDDGVRSTAALTEGRDVQLAGSREPQPMGSGEAQTSGSSQAGESESEAQEEATRGSQATESSGVLVMESRGIQAKQSRRDRVAESGEARVAETRRTLTNQGSVQVRERTSRGVQFSPHQAAALLADPTT